MYAPLTNRLTRMHLHDHGGGGGGIPDLPSPLDRSVSTSLRLSRQGFRVSGRKTTFAVKSIRHGSQEWHSSLRPFVADLAFFSLTQRRFSSQISFRPYACHAAVLFVDLSGYSKITAAIAHRGAHTLSTLVNSYLARLLDIVRVHGGDVLKFAGDAILVVWYGAPDDNNDDWKMNLLAAAMCVLEMQRVAGHHPVDGTSLSFRIHCGLTCGLLESEIFAAPNHVHMQRLYHSVGGDCLQEISELVEMAKPGEVCVSGAVAEYLGTRGTYQSIPNQGGCKILTGLSLDPDVAQQMEDCVNLGILNRESQRQQSIEEEFIHPSVIRLLNHGGLSPTQIAQMRNLCVLFIAMTSNGSTVNWLMEVQSILDRHRCPIVQIIDDDKGVHLVAAVNLYESIPECSLAGLDVCRELVDKQVGCTIGMSSGSTFCGVTGSSGFACRWDITGPPPVRAARLMQFALDSDLEVAIDQSVYNDPMAATRMESLDCTIRIKGTGDPIPVFSLSSSNRFAAFRVLETVHGRVHDDVVIEITEHIRLSKNRIAVIVTGEPLAGKKIVCQRAAGFANLVPYLHLSDATAGFLQLARTIATWFRYVDNDAIRNLADDVLQHLRKDHFSRAHDSCIDLVELSLSNGFRACFLVDRVQFLDEFSLSLLRECLQDRKTGSRQGSKRHLRASIESPSLTGKVCFLCVHVALYNWKSASDVVDDLSRSQSTVSIPTIQLRQAPRDQLRTMFRDMSDMEVEDRWLDAYCEASGHCAGYFIERTAAIRTLSGKLWSQGVPGYAETTEDLVLHIPPGLVRMNRRLPVTQVSAEVAMRFSQVFDELPPLYQTALKIVTIATRNGFYKLPLHVLWEVLNDLIADGVEKNVLQIVTKEIADMFLLEVEIMDGKEILSIRSPAFSDVAFDVCTPIQVHSISESLIERLDNQQNDGFRVSMVKACLHYLIGNDEALQRQCWIEGYENFKSKSKGMAPGEISIWMERIDDEITASGLSSQSVLGKQFDVQTPSKKVVGKILPLLKIYSAPISLGPMGHSLSVLTRNTFHEFGIFHGASSDKAAVELRHASTTAAARYLAEMSIIEGFLMEHGICANDNDLKDEREMIHYLAKPAVNSDAVQIKAATILDELVPRYINIRLERLYALVKKLREVDDEIPPLMQRSDVALRQAYEVFRGADADTKRRDAAQDALMIMATKNWKPKKVPEHLPLLHYQTVARIRNKVLKRLNDAELFIFKHRQSDRDLEVFLVVTALLYEAQTNEQI